MSADVLTLEDEVMKGVTSLITEIADRRKQQLSENVKEAACELGDTIEVHVGSGKIIGVPVRLTLVASNGG